LEEGGRARARHAGGAAAGAVGHEPRRALPARRIGGCGGHLVVTGIAVRAPAGAKCPCT
jgi:hypothetical protein